MDTNLYRPGFLASMLGFIIDIQYYCALTGLGCLDVPFHRASPCANIFRPFRAFSADIFYS